MPDEFDNWLTEHTKPKEKDEFGAWLHERVAETKPQEPAPLPTAEEFFKERRVERGRRRTEKEAARPRTEAEIAALIEQAAAQKKKARRKAELRKEETLRKQEARRGPILHGLAQGAKALIGGVRAVPTAFLAGVEKMPEVTANLADPGRDSPMMRKAGELYGLGAQTFTQLGVPHMIPITAAAETAEALGITAQRPQVAAMSGTEKAWSIATKAAMMTAFKALPKLGTKNGAVVKPFLNWLGKRGTTALVGVPAVKSALNAIEKTVQEGGSPQEAWLAALDTGVKEAALLYAVGRMNKWVGEKAHTWKEPVKDSKTGKTRWEKRKSPPFEVQRLQRETKAIVEQGERAIGEVKEKRARAGKLETLKEAEIRKQIERQQLKRGPQPQEPPLEPPPPAEKPKPKLRTKLQPATLPGTPTKPTLTPKPTYPLLPYVLKKKGRAPLPPLKRPVPKPGEAPDVFFKRATKAGWEFTEREGELGSRPRLPPAIRAQMALRGKEKKAADRLGEQEIHLEDFLMHKRMEKPTPPQVLIEGKAIQEYAAKKPVKIIPTKRPQPPKLVEAAKAKQPKPVKPHTAKPLPVNGLRVAGKPAEGLPTVKAGKLTLVEKRDIGESLAQIMQKGPKKYGNTERAFVDEIIKKHGTTDLGGDALILREAFEPPTPKPTAKPAKPVPYVETLGGKAQKPSKGPPKGMGGVSGEWVGGKFIPPKIPPSERAPEVPLSPGQRPPPKPLRPSELPPKGPVKKPRLARRAEASDFKVVSTTSELLRMSLKSQERAGKIAYKAGQVELKAQQRAMLKRAKERLPDRAFKAIADATGAIITTRGRTPEKVWRDFEAAVDRIIIRHEKAVAITEFRAELKKARKGKLDPFYAQKLRDLEDTLAVKKPTPESVRKMKAVLDAADKDILDQMPKDLIEKARRTLTDAQKRGAVDFSAEELRETTNAIKAIVHQSKTKQRITIGRRERELSEVSEEIGHDVTVRHGTKQSVPAEERETTKKRGGIRRAVGLDLQHPHTIARNLGGEDSVATRVFSTDPVESQRVAQELSRATNSTDWIGAIRKAGISSKDLQDMSESAARPGLIRRGVRKLLGKPTGKRAKTVTVNLRTAADEKGKPVRSLDMTAGELIELAGNLSDSQTRKLVLKGAPILFARQYSRGAITLKATDIVAIENSLTPKMKIVLKQAQHVMTRSNLQDKFARANEAEHGIEFKTRPDHWARRRSQEYMDVDPARVRRNFNHNMLESMGITKQRTGGKTPFVITDVFEHVDSHIRQMSSYVGKTRAANNMAKLLWGKPGRPFRQSIRRGYTNGEDIIDSLRKQHDAFVGEEFVSPTAAEKILGRFTRRAQLGAVVGKPQVMLNQVLSIIPGSHELGWKHMKGAAKHDPWMINRLLKAHSAEIAGRFEGTGHEILTPFSGGAGEALATRMGFKTPLSKRAWGIKQFDTATITMLGAGAYEKGISRGLKGKALNEYTARETERLIHLTQPSSSVMTTPALLRRARHSPGLRAFLLFSNQRTQQWNMTLRAYQDYQAAPSPKAFHKMAAATLTSVVAGGVGVYAIRRSTKRVLSGPDEKAKLQDHIVEMAENTLGSNVLTGKALGIIVNATNKIIQDKPASQFYQVLPAQVGEDLVVGFSEIIRHAVRDIENDPKRRKRFIKGLERFVAAAGTAAGVTGIQAVVQAKQRLEKRFEEKPLSRRRPRRKGLRPDNLKR